MWKQLKQNHCDVEPDPQPGGNLGLPPSSRNFQKDFERLKTFSVEVKQ